MTTHTRTNATDPMRAGTPGSTACPVCGDELPDRSGRPGRPAAWCSKSCRQAAHRARRTSERAVAEAAVLSDRIAGDATATVSTAETELRAAVLAMCEAAPGDAEAALRDAAGWETGVADAARRLARAALAVADLADRHAAVAADYRRARAVFRRPELMTPARDETPPGSVASTAAKAPATKPGTGDGGNVAAAAAAHGATKPAPVEVDADELFDAIEDVLQDVDGVPGTSFAAALDALAAVHADATGDGPHGALVAAAAVAVRARPPHLPARADAAITRLAAALPKEVVTST